MTESHSVLETTDRGLTDWTLRFLISKVSKFLGIGVIGNILGILLWIILPTEWAGEGTMAGRRKGNAPYPAFAGWTVHKLWAEIGRMIVTPNNAKKATLVCYWCRTLPGWLVTFAGQHEAAVSQPKVMGRLGSPYWLQQATRRQPHKCGTKMTRTKWRIYKELLIHYRVALLSYHASLQKVCEKNTQNLRYLGQKVRSSARVTTGSSGIPASCWQRQEARTTSREHTGLRGNPRTLGGNTPHPAKPTSVGAHDQHVSWWQCSSCSACTITASSIAG